MYFNDKFYDHTNGWAACFRQPGASSHCRDPHGYPLAFRLRFQAEILDKNNWVLDFGGLKQVKAWHAEHFDHRTLLAADDPHLQRFHDLYDACGFAPIIVLPFVGCEGFAKYSYDFTSSWLFANHPDAYAKRGLRLHSVTVYEHAGNSATYQGVE